MPTKSATILASEVRKMKSKATGKSYQISIALPYSYVDDSIKIDPFDKPLTAWPVVYLTDSNWYFGMVTDIVRVSAWMGGTSDAIVVGIGYPEMETPQETWRNIAALRLEDLTPTQSVTSEKYNNEWLKRDVKSGGGGQFLNFIKQELIPMIEKDYRTEPARRVLMGHSHGGIFSLFAMLQEPGLFSRYIAGSPSLAFAEKFMFTFESDFAKKHKKLSAQLYLAAGELEEEVGDTTVSDMVRFSALLESRKYKGFSLTKHVFPDSNHTEVVGHVFQSGLKLALKK
jgi:predicted alpha/beta superfamily hydrolase